MADPRPDAADHEPDDHHDRDGQEREQRGLVQPRRLGQGREDAGGEVDGVVADRHHREPLHRLLQAELQRRPPVHAPEHLDVLRLVVHVHPGAQEVRRPLGAGGELGQPLLGRAAGAHGRVEAADHELLEDLPAADPLLAQHLDALHDDGLVGARGPEAEGAGRGEVLDLGRHLQEPVQRLRLLPGLARHVRHHVGQLAVDARHRPRHLARQRQGQHRHALVGLDLQQPLHDPPEAALADPGPRQHEEPAVPVLVDAEVGGDHRLAVHHPADREALAHEPLRQVRGDSRLHVLRLGRVDPHEARGHHPARRLGEPVRGEELEHLAREGPRRQPLGEEGVGDELGVHLPFQEAPPHGAVVVARPRRRVRGAVAVEERREMRPVGVAVAVGGVLGLLDREVDGAAGRGQLGERPRVQLVRQRVAIGIVVEGQLRHGGTPLCSRPRCHVRPANPPAIRAAGAPPT